MYQIERVVKAFWDQCCFWCCFRCCWQRHYGGSTHHAARVHVGKEEDEQTDSAVSSYDDEDDRWGAVSFDDTDSGSGSDEDDDDSDRSDSDCSDDDLTPRSDVSGERLRGAGVGIAGIGVHSPPAMPQMDLSHLVASAEGVSDAAVRKCAEYSGAETVAMARLRTMQAGRAGNSPQPAAQQQQQQQPQQLVVQTNLTAARPQSPHIVVARTLNTPTSAVRQTFFAGGAVAGVAAGSPAVPAGATPTMTLQMPMGSAAGGLPGFGGAGGTPIAVAFQSLGGGGGFTAPTTGTPLAAGGGSGSPWMSVQAPGRA